MKNRKMKNLKSLIILFIIPLCSIFGQSMEGNVNNLPVHEYTLTIKEEMVNKAGKQIKGMTVNGTIPGPTLEFTEGEKRNERGNICALAWFVIAQFL